MDKNRIGIGKLYLSTVILIKRLQNIALLFFTKAVQIHPSMDGWMDGWMVGWMDGWMNISDLFSCDMTRYNLRNTDDFS